MITFLKLTQFRNHKDLELCFTKPLVAITGPNASGKTNIIESIFVSSFTKSFRSSDQKLIEHNKDFFTIDRQDDKFITHIRFINSSTGRQKQLKIQNVKKPLHSIIGVHPVVLFEPTDLNLFIGLPGARRDYLNKILSQIDKHYLQNLRIYKKILAQRNSLLKRAKKEPVNNVVEQLFIYNLQLVEPGVYISNKRLELIQSLQVFLTTYYRAINGEKKDIDIYFQPTATKTEVLLKNIEDATDIDRAVGFSTVGPHREDFTVTLQKYNLGDAASRGELRTLVLAAKLAELDYIEQITKKRPTLLLDDVLSELDDTRQSYLLGSLSKQQTFITTTHLPQKLNTDFQHINLPL